MSLALGLVGVVAVILSVDRYGVVALVLNLSLVVPCAIVGVGVVGGSIREYRRGENASA